MKFKGLEIDMHKFYGIGVVCFGIVALANTVVYAQLIANQSLNMFETISRTASLVFNYALFGFFLWLKRGLPPKNIDQAKIEEMGGIFNER